MTAVAARPGRTVAALTTRLARRSTIAVTVAVALFMVVEAFAFDATYPNEATRQALILWTQEPGIRIILGPGSAVQTLGGFVAWDAGLYLSLGLGAWALVLATRILRGDEAAGRSDLLLARGITPTRMLVLQVAVLATGCLVVGATLGATLAVAGAQVSGAALYGVMTIGYCTALVALAALASQVFAHRRTALGAAAATFAGLALLRMVGNSADERSWLTWLTPTGWMDRSQAFGDNHWWVALIPTVVVAALLAAAVAVRRVRDTGAGLVPERQRHRSQPWGLGSPTAFAFRSQAGVLASWALGMVLAGLVLGALLPTISDVLATDTGFQDFLAMAGVQATDLTRSFIALWASILGLALAVFGVFRVGALRAEESSGRADLLLVRPLPRWRWLAGHLLWLAAGLGALALTAGAAMWLAAAVTGARMDAGDPFRAMVNTLPAVAALTALCVAVFGLMPRLSVPVGIGAVATAYVVALVGPPLSWPTWLVDLSAFHHVAQVPLEDVSWTAAGGLLAASAVLVALGLAAFTRRDLVGE